MSQSANGAELLREHEFHTSPHGHGADQTMSAERGHIKVPCEHRSTGSTDLAFKEEVARLSEYIHNGTQSSREERD
jgi:hypothetical protein